MGAVRTYTPTATLAAGANSSAGPITIASTGFTPPVLWWQRLQDLYTQFWVSNNGLMTLGGLYTSQTPVALSGLVDAALPILCPLWLPIDTTSQGTVTYKNIQYFYTSAPDGSVASQYDGHYGIAVTWTDVAPPGGGAERNTFQVVILGRPDAGPNPIDGGPAPRPYCDWDIEFNYDKVQWDNGGVFRIGFSNGEIASGQVFEFPGSGRAGYFLDSNSKTGLIYHSHNSLVPGRYVFHVRTALRSFVRLVDAEGLANGESIDNYYNDGLGGSGSGPGPKHGIVFTGAQAIGGSSNSPAGSGTLFQYAGAGIRSVRLHTSPMLIDIASGFRGEFSANYHVPDPAGATIEFYDATGGTGTLLKTTTLPDSGAESWTAWKTIVVPVPGTVKSLKITGTVDRVHFDSMRFGTYYGGLNAFIPELPPDAKGCTPMPTPFGAFPNDQESAP